MPTKKVKSASGYAKVFIIQPCMVEGEKVKRGEEVEVETKDAMLLVSSNKALDASDKDGIKAALAKIKQEEAALKKAAGGGKGGGKGGASQADVDAMQERLDAQDAKIAELTAQAEAGSAEVAGGPPSGSGDAP